METDRETVEQLVKKLKEEIKHVNAFVILFNGQVCWQWSSMSFFSFGQSPRFTHGLKSMIKLFEDIFGPGFWPNVIFAVSRYDRTLSGKFLRKLWSANWSVVTTPPQMAFWSSSC